MDFFIALTFSPNFLQFKKIDSYRKRFDLKYNKTHHLHMSLFAPFTLPKLDLKEYRKFTTGISEEIDSHFSGLEEMNQIIFYELDFNSYNGKNLFLKPTIDINFEHCLNGISRILNEYCHNKKIDQSKKILLPIARSLDSTQLEQAVSEAQKEFQLPLILFAKTISLFEKTSDSWIQRSILYEFDNKNELTENRWYTSDINFN